MLQLTGRRARRLSVALAVALALAALASPVYGFSYIQSCGPTWTADKLPLSYYINEEGTPDLSMSIVEAIVDDSFAQWETPCCSEFASRYAGQTDETADAARDEVVLSWTEQWPSALGNSSRTIAVTQSAYERPSGEPCYLTQSAILFNNQGFRFSEDGAWDTIDLAGVATHEIGHLIGLGHTSYETATMYALYQGTAATMTLHQDDVDGVCDLYSSASGCECRRHDDCPTGQVCNEGACVERIDCTEHGACPDGQMCEQGICAPGTCDVAGDCPPGLACDGVRCRDTCPVCATCQTSDDCDGASFCATLADGTSRCMLACGPATECPGNTRCYGVQTDSGRSFGACLNADVDANGVCPDGFVCTPDDGAAEASCPGVGNVCDASAPACGSNRTACMRGWKSQPVCTCQCSSDADCGPGASCEAAGNQAFCLPDDYDDPPCDTADCPTGEVCIDGACAPWLTNGEVPPDDVGGADTGVDTDAGGSTSDSDWQRDRRRVRPKPHSDDGCAISEGPAGRPAAPIALILWLAAGLAVLRRRLRAAK